MLENAICFLIIFDAEGIEKKVDRFCADSHQINKQRKREEKKEREKEININNTHLKNLYNIQKAVDGLRLNPTINGSTFRQNLVVSSMTS